MSSSFNWDDKLIIDGKLWNMNSANSLETFQGNTNTPLRGFTGIDLALWLILFSPDPDPDSDSSSTPMNPDPDDVDVVDIDFSDIDFPNDQGEWEEYQEQIEDFVTEVNNFDSNEYFDQFIEESDIDFLGLDSIFFEDYANIFDGINTDFLNNFNSFFADIDTSFLNEVDSIIKDFEIAEYIEILFEASSPNPKQLDNLNVLLQNIDDLTLFSELIEDSLVRGTAYNDGLRGFSDNDILLGLGGSDRISGRRGDDLINGGAKDDKIKGKQGDDFLFGSYGRDNIRGGNGDDVIFGGDGKDKLMGGRGSDIYMFDKNSGLDKILGFKIDKDFIQLADNVDTKDLEVVDRQGSALIRFVRGSGHGGRLALLNNLSSSQFSIEDIIRNDSLLSTDFVTQDV